MIVCVEHGIAYVKVFTLYINVTGTVNRVYLHKLHVFRIGTILGRHGL